MTKSFFQIAIFALALTVAGSAFAQTTESTPAPRPLVGYQVNPSIPGDGYRMVAPKQQAQAEIDELAEACGEDAFRAQENSTLSRGGEGLNSRMNARVHLYRAEIAAANGNAAQCREEIAWSKYFAK